MQEKQSRHRFKNFFLKKSIQLRIITGILFTVLLSGLLIISLLAITYNKKAQEGNFYYMTNNDDDMQNLELDSILKIVLFPIIAVEIVAIIIAFGIGLFSSRKVAVPLYKIEKWAMRLKNGKLNTTLAFREENAMKDLTIQCNGVTEFFRSLCGDIREHVEGIAHQPDDVPMVVRKAQLIKELLDKVELH